MPDPRAEIKDESFGDPIFLSKADLDGPSSEEIFRYEEDIKSPSLANSMLREAYLELNSIEERQDPELLGESVELLFDSTDFTGLIGNMPGIIGEIWELHAELSHEWEKWKDREAAIDKVFEAKFYALVEQDSFATPYSLVALNVESGFSHVALDIEESLEISKEIGEGFVEIFGDLILEHSPVYQVTTQADSVNRLLGLNVNSKDTNDNPEKDYAEQPLPSMPDFDQEREKEQQEQGQEQEQEQEQELDSAAQDENEKTSFSYDEFDKDEYDSY